MSETQVPPEIAKALRDMSRRLDIIERRLRAQPADFKSEIVFSYSGALLEGAVSPPYTLGVSERMFVVDGLLGSAGSTDTVVTVFQNGAPIGAVTIAAGTFVSHAPFSVVLAPGQDVLAFGIDTVGTGAQDLTAIARFRPV